MAVCSASMMAVLGRVASDHGDALWVEQQPSPITGTASAASSDIPAKSKVFCTSPERPRHVLKKPIGFVHGSAIDPCTNRLGF